jgi:hypothetical protein
MTARAVKRASDNLRRLADQASRASAQNIVLTRGQEKAIAQAARNTGRTYEQQLAVMERTKRSFEAQGRAATEAGRAGQRAAVQATSAQEKLGVAVAGVIRTADGGHCGTYQRSLQHAGI